MFKRPLYMYLWEFTIGFMVGAIIAVIFKLVVVGN